MPSLAVSMTVVTVVTVEELESSVTVGLRSIAENNKVSVIYVLSMCYLCVVL